MITIKTKEEIEILREGGKRLAKILSMTAELVKVGVDTFDLNKFAHEKMIALGDKPAFLNYTPYGADRPYPAALCVSVNDEIVHGIPNEKKKILKEGDIVSLDAGLIHKGLYTDSAITVPVGKISKEDLKLIDATKKALDAGIFAAGPGKRVGEISFAIESVAKKSGFSLAEGLAGHGVGYSVHEDPYVPNSGKKTSGPILKEGMVIAIEPMLNRGGAKIIQDDDGHTYKTADGGKSAHFEHTVVITENGVEILTQ